jgi:YD repeat-containing protein
MSWWSIDPVPFGWSYYQPYPGTFVYLLYAMKARCPVPCPSCQETQASVPIKLATGDTYIEEQDISIPGLGGGLSLRRTWRSIWPGRLGSFQTGIFGAKWRSTYEERIVMSTDNFVTYLRGDGTFWTFGVGATYTSWVVSGPANAEAVLNTDTSTNSYFTLTFSNGEQRRFDGTTGRLTTIIDRNGNTTLLTYDSSGRLTTVTDPVSRTLTFTYDATFTNQVASVSSSVGVSYSYAYDTSGRLIKVTKPDQTTVSFTYDSQSRITSVTDSNGKVLESHTYDNQNRGLTGSQANGVQAVTVSYQ